MSTQAKDSEPTIIARSEAMQALDADLLRAAKSDAKVLITGETGVGKEVAARLIHRRSPRAASAMVTLNCAGLPDSLLESELFGHVKGSFTGAYRDKPGLLEMAPGGTVFLDEVGEMSPRMQAILLRFLETGEIQRVGADRSYGRVNVRLITATNRSLEREVASGAFREDLFFRLNVIRLTIPPLRERADDIAPLLDHYLTFFGRLHRMPAVEMAPDALRLLTGYRWPGNIRELKNVVERMVLKAAGPVAGIDDLPIEVLGEAAATSAAAEAPAASLSQAEQLAGLMLGGTESFWTAVYPLFMARDLTRQDLRRIVQIGLARTRGNYRLLVQSFNMPDSDYKRFLSFLRKHDCHLPFHHFRSVSAVPDAPPLRAVVGGKG